MGSAITEASIRTLAKGEQVMCGKLSGFGARRTPGRGHLRFFIRRLVGNRDHRRTIGTHPNLSVRVARSIARVELAAFDAKSDERFTRRARGEDSTAASTQLNQILELLTNKKTEQKRSPTLGCYMAEKMIPTWSELSVNTQEAYHSSWKLWVAPRWAHTPLHEITGKGIDRWFRTLHPKKRSANQARKLLLRILRVACNDGLIDRLPVPTLKAYPTTKRVGLSARDLAKLMAHLQSLLQTNPSSHLWAVITMLNTGERREACVSLKVREVDFEQRLITKRRKGGKIEALPITDYAAAFLHLIRPAKGTYFFPSKTSRTGHIHGTCLLQWFQRECIKLGITSTNGRAPVIHTLRHTWASTLARNGVPLAHIQQLLGHSSMQTTMRYIHGDKDAARAAASAITETRVDFPGIKPTGVE